MQITRPNVTTKSSNAESFQLSIATLKIRNLITWPIVITCGSFMLSSLIVSQVTIFTVGTTGSKQSSASSNSTELIKFDVIIKIIMCSSTETKGLKKFWSITMRTI